MIKCEKNKAVKIFSNPATVSTLSSSKLLLPSSWSINENIRNTRLKYDVKGRGIKVAILDSGININHECFFSSDKKSRIKKTKNFFPIKKKVLEKTVGRRKFYKTIIDDSNNIDDNAGHGTFCAGVVSSDNENISVAPEAELYIAKVLDDKGNGTIETIVAGIQWAISEDVHIISMSFGYTGDMNPFIKAAMEAALKKDIILVCAAGNEGPYKNSISSPGNFVKIITVGACDKNDTVAYFSSRGAQLDFIAPGVDVLCCYDSKSIPLKMKNKTYALMSGTSMATPFVAGCAALFLEYHLFKKKKEKDSSVTVVDKILLKEIVEPDLQSEKECRCSLFEKYCKENCVIDLGEVGFDEDYGAGKIFLDFEKKLNKIKI